MAAPEDGLSWRGYVRASMTSRGVLTLLFRGRRRRGRAVALALAGALMAGLIASRAQSEQSRVPRVPAVAASAAVSGVLTVTPTYTITVPSSFFGLSTEYWTLPVDLRHIGLYRRVISLLQVPGDSPFVLRIGGDSSDQAGA